MSNINKLLKLVNESVGATLMSKDSRTFMIETDYGKTTGIQDRAGIVQILRNCQVDNPDHIVDQSIRNDSKSVHIQLPKVPSDHFH